jgi:hypothetical protein
MSPRIDPKETTMNAQTQAAPRGARVARTALAVVAAALIPITFAANSAAAADKADPTPGQGDIEGWAASQGGVPPGGYSGSGGSAENRSPQDPNPPACFPQEPDAPSCQAADPYLDEDTTSWHLLYRACYDRDPAPWKLDCFLYWWECASDPAPPVTPLPWHGGSTPPIFDPTVHGLPRGAQ